MERPLRIIVRIGDAVGEAQLNVEDAPRTVESFWRALPIRDRAIHVRWSGSAWRTEGDHELLSKDDPVESVASRLEAGDLIYYPGYRSGLLKIGFAYGDAQWLAPFRRPLDVSLIGRVDRNLAGLVAESERILTHGAIDVELLRAGSDIT